MKPNKFLKYFFLVVVGVLFVGPLMVQAADVDLLPINPINPNIPGENEATQADPNPMGIIGNLFQFALLIGGLLAFVMIVYGGIEYAATGDSGSGQKDAKERIQQALLGLLLLAGAFVLLQTINPQLTKLSFPTLADIKGGGDLFPELTAPASQVGGRCLNNQCGAGAFCFKDDKCYANIGCSEEDNSNLELGDSDFCEASLESVTGHDVEATCNEEKICELSENYTCAGGPVFTYGCNDSKESCVNGFCKFYGIEGAKSKNGKCAYNGLEPNADGICVRVSADDIPCGDQTGSCEGGQSCVVDFSNLGKYKCSSTPGPDGICAFGKTPQDCMLEYGQNGGGYCHQQDCYSNGAGPFPG